MKKTFIAKLEIAKRFLEICHEDEVFFLQFENEDEWQDITMKDGEIYGVHLSLDNYMDTLYEWNVAIYAVKKVIVMDDIVLLEDDTSEDGQQNLRLYFE